jgi:hypothetical protein
LKKAIISYFQSVKTDANGLHQIKRQKPKGMSNISGKKERMEGRLVEGKTCTGK